MKTKQTVLLMLAIVVSIAIMLLSTTIDSYAVKSDSKEAKITELEFRITALYGTILHHED